jgi:tetratricopeptide (TPR) repeat protein
MAGFPNSSKSAVILLTCWVAFSGTRGGGKAQQESPDDLFTRGTELLAKGDTEGAIQAYQALLKNHPERIDARSNLGAAYARLGRYEDAVQQYQKALQFDPENSAIRFNLGLAYYKAAQFLPAATELAKVVASQPDNTNPVLILADCYLSLGEYKDVIGLLGPRQAAFQDDRAFLYLLGTAFIRDGQTEKGQVLVDRILRNGESAEARLLLGMAHLMVSDYPGALKELTRAVELNPKLPSVNLFYARALLANGQREKASEAFRRELEQNPNDYETNYYLGVLLKEDRQFEKAMGFLQRALVLRPGAINARFQMGSLHLAADNLPEAEHMLEEVAKDAPDFPDVHAALAKLYYRLKRKEDGDREQAILLKLNAEVKASVRGAAEKAQAERELPPEPAPPPHSENSPVTDPDFDDLVRRAEAARLATRLDEALTLYRQAVQLRPEWPEGWWYLGTINYERDGYAEARDAFVRLLYLKPTGGPSWALLGLCEFKLGNYQIALDHLQRARAQGLGGSRELSRVARYHTGILHTHFGQFEAAQQQLFPLARDQLNNTALIEALGVAALALPLFPTEIPPEKRELVLKAGRASYFQAARLPEDAQREYTELLAQYPKTPNVHYSYGVFLLIQNPDQALVEFRRELEISPAHVPARLQIAFEYIRRGESSTALPFAEQAVKIAPEAFAARNALGRIYLEMGQVERAVKELEEGVRLAPGSPETRYALARAYTKAGRKAEAAREREEFARLKKLQQELRGIPRPPIETDPRPDERPPG